MMMVMYLLLTLQYYFAAANFDADFYAAVLLPGAVPSFAIFVVTIRIVQVNNFDSLSHLILLLFHYLILLNYYFDLLLILAV